MSPNQLPSEKLVRLQEQNSCTNCCGQGYFGLSTDCRACAGTGKVPACKTVTNHRQCLLKDGQRLRVTALATQLEALGDQVARRWIRT